MAFIILPNKCLQQPQQVGPVNYSNQSSQGLVDVWNGYAPSFISSFGSPRLITPTANPIAAPVLQNGMARGATYDGTSQYHSITSSAITNTVEGTLLVVCNPSTITATTRSIFGYGNSASANTLFFIGQGSSSGQLSFFARSDANTAQNLQVAGPASWANGAPAVLVGTRSESRNFQRLYINGVTQSPTTATALGTSTLNRTTVGGLVRNSPGIFWNGSVYLALSWNRALDDAEIIEISRNPWQVLLNQPKRFYLGPPTASTITGTSATTNANDTSTASGSPVIVGTLAKTNANDTSTASGTTTITGTLAKTNANDTSTASGTTTVSGSLAKTNANDTSSASGTTSIVGTSTAINANDTSSSAGTTKILGSAADTNINDTSTASGVVGSITGSAACINNNDTASANGSATSSADSHDGVDAYYYKTPKQRKKEREEEERKRKKHWKEELEEAKAIRKLLVSAFDPTKEEVADSAPGKANEKNTEQSKIANKKLLSAPSYQPKIVNEIKQQVAQLQKNVKAIKPDIITKDVARQQKEASERAIALANEDEEEAQLVVQMVIEYERRLIDEYASKMQELISAFS